MASAAVTPAIIVGKGRVGQALLDMGAGEDVILGRGEAIAGPEGPIIVCTRNNDLQGSPLPPYPILNICVWWWGGRGWGGEPRQRIQHCHEVAQALTMGLISCPCGKVSWTPLLRNAGRI